MAKKYLLFMFDNDEPSGGASDFVACGTKKQCKAAASKADIRIFGCVIAQIVTSEMEIVAWGCGDQLGAEKTFTMAWGRTWEQASAKFEKLKAELAPKPVYVPRPRNPWFDVM